MSKRSLSTAVGLVLIVAFSVWSMTPKHALAQNMHQHGSHAGQQHQGLSPAGTIDASATQPTPHGGQLTILGQFRFEVVYRPRESRVYLYDASNRPISARGVQGQLAMTVRGSEKVYRYPLKYVAAQAGTRTHDYLALAVNLGRIKDGDMSVAIELANLPNRGQPRATFTQTFALSKIPVRVVALDESDRAGIAQQKVCPVTGGQLGGMGTPIKVLLGDQPIYLCCKGCLGKVQKNPEAYLPKATTNKLAVSSSSTSDQAAIAQQRVCVVSGSRLGSMGTPVKVTKNGQSLFLCCKGCVGKVKKDPVGYFAKAAQLRAGR